MCSLGTHDRSDNIYPAAKTSTTCWLAILISCSNSLPWKLKPMSPRFNANLCFWRKKRTKECLPTNLHPGFVAFAPRRLLCARVLRRRRLHLHVVNVLGVASYDRGYKRRTTHLRTTHLYITSILSLYTNVKVQHTTSLQWQVSVGCSPPICTCDNETIEHHGKRCNKTLWSLWDSKRGLMCARVRGCARVCAGACVCAVQVWLRVSDSGYAVEWVCVCSNASVFCVFLPSHQAGPARVSAQEEYLPPHQPKKMSTGSGPSPMHPGHSFISLNISVKINVCSILLTKEH